MDPIENIDINGDTTFRLALEAQVRKHEIWFYTPEKLYFENNSVFSTVNKIFLKDEPKNFYKLEKSEVLNLSTFDIILMRQDPPFDMSYITLTHLLEMLPSKTLVINNPFEVRNSPEKIFVLKFKDLIPPTLISRDIEIIRNFRKKHGEIIIKPIYGNGGSGIFRISSTDSNFNPLLEMFFSLNNEPVIAQKYIPEVVAGDKRIILINGEPVGAINRIPKRGEIRSNLHVGGKAKYVSLTNRDKYICSKIGPKLIEKKLFFVGIDIIGNYLTEINVTSPTGIREIENFSKINIAKLFWELIENKF